MINVILIFGGKSGEHEVSLKSAQSIYNCFDKEKYKVFPLCIGKSGKWFGPVPGDKIKDLKKKIIWVLKWQHYLFLEEIFLV
jgi:D-alanine-D-alanine ligase